VRGTVTLAVLCLATSASANKASNPAFLGVGMEDSGGVRGAGPCTITSIEQGSPAEAAALQPTDVFDKLDGTPIPNCDALISLITARAPGTIIELDIRRHAQPLKVKAQLMTRDEILRRRLVGQSPAADLIRVDDRALVDLGTVKRTTIVGWFPISCAGCDAVFAEVARWSRERKDRRAPVAVMAATADLAGHRSARDSVEHLRTMRRSLEVPLLAADYDTYARFAMKDVDRVHFMVIDCRGVVQYVAPVVPDVDDTRAALEELYTAAEQTSRLVRR
jgi:hypothetical protein